MLNWATDTITCEGLGKSSQLTVILLDEGFDADSFEPVNLKTVRQPEP